MNATLIVHPWQTEAFKYKGVKEIKGFKHNPIILGFWKAAKLSGIKNDEEPWCAGFLCAIFENVGIRSPRSDAARSFLKWGTRILNPVYGCVVVFGRKGGGGGHTGIVNGFDRQGNLLVWAGNQDDQVKESAFALSKHEVLGYMIPPGYALHQFSPVPIVDRTGQLSVSEA